MAVVWLSGPNIELESCELPRINEATTTLLTVLGDSVEEAEIREVGADFDEEVDFEDEDETFNLILSELTRGDNDESIPRRIHRFLDNRYRATLDQPLDDLGGSTPRELTQTAKGRKQLVKWLNNQESNLHGNTALSGQSDYDFT